MTCRIRTQGVVVVEQWALCRQSDELVVDGLEQDRALAHAPPLGRGGDRRLQTTLQVVERNRRLAIAVAKQRHHRHCRLGELRPLGLLGSLRREDVAAPAAAKVLQEPESRDERSLAEDAQDIDGTSPSHGRGE